MPAQPLYRVYPCGDHAATIELGDSIDAGINAKAIAVFRYLKERAGEGILDIIPSYHTVTLIYDLVQLKKQHPAALVYDVMRSKLLHAAQACEEAGALTARVFTIPVCYDPLLAPDLATLAALHGLHSEEVIQYHTAPTYRVYMIGFLPGFAYMGSVDKKIVTPRRKIPRTLVPAGSVGIAGEQTGIYPSDSPGGWQLIGQTPLTMFSPAKKNPCLLQPGDEVHFYPVSLAAFTKLKNA